LLWFKFLRISQICYHHLFKTPSSLYTHFYACATSVDPDQPAHSCHLVRICTGRILARNNQTNQSANSVDPVQTVRICRLIWIYTVRPHNKGIYMYMKEMHKIDICLDKNNDSPFHLLQCKCNGLVLLVFLQQNNIICYTNRLIQKANKYL
jgi:hypothetical protein